MRVRNKSGPRLLVAAAAAAALALPGSAFAQIAYSGYTNGCFGAGCTPVNSNGGFQFDQLVMGNSTLRYANATFSGSVPAGSYFMLTSTASAIFQQQVNNLGAFYLTMGNTNVSTYSDVFTLAVRFADPGSGLGVFSALLSGTIQVGQAAPNRVQIDFSPTQQAINWVNHVTGEVGVIDLGITQRQVVIAGQLNQTSRANIVGEGVITVAPEPMSMILVGSGLLGMAGAARRRRRIGEGGSALV